MIYQHQHFQLDTGSRKAFDENGKELRLTGNAFRVLAFLCEKKNANLTEIGDHLDHAKEYDENHLRQYRYKINTIIGKDVIEYKNGIYSLVGDCNTDLLQSNSPKLETVKENIVFNIYPGIIAAILLLLSFFDWPYGYYTLLRWVVAGVSIYYAYLLYTTYKNKIAWFWGLVITAILFNPIIPVYLYDKSLWNIIDMIVAVFFVVLIIRLKK